MVGKHKNIRYTNNNMQKQNKKQNKRQHKEKLQTVARSIDKHRPNIETNVVDPGRGKLILKSSTMQDDWKLYCSNKTQDTWSLQSETSAAGIFSNKSFSEALEHVSAFTIHQTATRSIRYKADTINSNLTVIEPRSNTITESKSGKDEPFLIARTTLASPIVKTKSDDETCVLSPSQAGIQKHNVYAPGDDELSKQVVKRVRAHRNARKI